MPRKNRTWEPVESRLLSEWLAVRFPDAHVIQHVRVGTYRPAIDITGLTPEEIRALSVWRRWVDAVVLQDHLVTLIEASVIPDVGHVAELELYLELWPMTPEYAEWRDVPTEGLLLYAVDDPVVRELAARRTIGVEVYHPPWVDEYLRRLPPRKRQAPKTILPGPRAEEYT